MPATRTYTGPATDHVAHRRVVLGHWVRVVELAAAATVVLAFFAYLASKD